MTLRKSLYWGMSSFILGYSSPVMAQQVTIVDSPPTTIQAPIKPPPSIITSTSAPESLSLPPADKKAAKKLRKKNNSDLALCANRRKLEAWMLENMVQACDRLLAQAQPFKNEYLDRALLLHYRSLALIADSHMDKAMETLEESNSLIAQKSDPLTNDSLRHSNQLLLSYIHNARGETDKAMQLVNAVRTARPYSKTFQVYADNFEISYDVSLSTIIKRLENRLIIDPDRRRNLIFLHLLNNDPESSYDIGQKLSLINPKQKRGWTRAGDEGEKGKLGDKILYMGTRAYVATLLDKKEEADSIYNELEADFVNYIGEDPRYSVDKNGVRKKRERPGKKKLKRYNQRIIDVDSFRETVEIWKTLTDIRMNQKITTIDQFREATASLDNAMSAFPAFLDLLRYVESVPNEAEASPKDAASENAEIAEAKPKKIYDILLNSILLNPHKLEKNALGQYIFATEHLDILPKYRSDNRISFVSGKNGFSQKREKNTDGDIRTIRFESLNSTAPVVEEMMFLALSDYASEDGKTKFILLANETVKRSIRTYGYRNYTSDAGYVAQVRVKFLNDAEAARESADNQKHIMSIADIEKNLRPKYDDYQKQKIIAKSKARAAKKKKSK